MRRRRALLILLALSLLALAPASTAPAGTRGHPRTHRRAAPITRYSLVHRCYKVRLRSGRKLGPFRLQAVALAEYLLYGVYGGFLGPDLSQVTAPSNATVWRVSGAARKGFRLINLATGRRVSGRFRRAGGCAVYPEGGVDASGRSFKGASPVAQVSGTIDAHTHVTAFEFLGGDFHCGKPWDRLGIPYALPDCARYEQGTNGEVESFLDYGSASHKHDTVGWPTFRAWPSPTDLAEEGDYYTGIERAWKAGLRIMATQLVDNEALCELMTKRHNPCNDMDAVHLQARDLRALQGYIDAQSGGPGKGFFRIVTNPFQARRVINSGKLAVVEGIEVSHLFNCGEYLGVPQCSRAQVDAGLKEVRALGVSTFFPIHKFDNAFGGTKMDSGETGALVNSGNHFETGQYWDVKTCTGPEHDSEQLTVAPAGALGQLINGPAATLTGGAPLPVYPPPPHCNQRGLTSLGAYLINKMIQEHFVVQLDHMDAKTADQALSILEAHHYSGVVSAHSWDSPQENPRIYHLGGFVTPIAGASPQAFIAQWRDSLKIRDRRFYNGTGFGYGADMNGLAEQSQPSSGHPINYPFRSFDGRVRFTRETWGKRVFDLNKDGVANYGMYPDWLQELKVLAGRAIASDMFRGAEAYLEMWERADGVHAPSCLPSRGAITRTGAGAVRLGQTLSRLLFAAGQPSSRPGRAYRYCIAGGAGKKVIAVFGRHGRVALVLSNGYRAGSLRPGAGGGALPRGAHRLAGGLWLGPSLRGGRRLLYAVRAGRVAFVGVASRGDAASRGALQRDVRAARI